MRKYLAMKKKKTTKKGFSFGEVILSVFVLSTGLLSVMGLMTSNLRHSMESRKTIIATGLAQEGVELVLNKSEDNVTKNGNSHQFDSLSDANNYCVGLQTGHVIGITGGCPNFTLNFVNTTPNIFYTHQGVGTSTSFKRQVRISTNAATHNRTVTSYVWWGAGTANPPAACSIANKCVNAQMLLVDKDGI